MKLRVKASDLYNKYAKDTTRRDRPKFSGKPDPHPFNRDDLYEIIPMLEQVMCELKCDDAHTLHTIEDIMNRDLPRCITSREETFDFLVGCMREIIESR